MYNYVASVIMKAVLTMLISIWNHNSNNYISKFFDYLNFFNTYTMLKTDTKTLTAKVLLNKNFLEKFESLQKNLVTTFS